MSPTPEQQASARIDRLLISFGWSGQDIAQANIHGALAVALREFPLNARFGTAECEVDANLEREEALRQATLSVSLSGRTLVEH